MTSVSLIILGSVILVYYNLMHMTQMVFQQANYSILLNDSIEDFERKEILAQLRSIPDIHNITELTSEQVKAELVESFGEPGQVLKKIDLPKFPNIIEFSLDRTSFLFEHEIDKIKLLQGVEEIVSGLETKDQINTFFTISEFVGVFLITLLIVSILMIIHNAIQIAVRMRIEEIEILQILGATPSFIRLPYIVEGLFIAIMGYLISMGIVFFLYKFVVAGITFNEATYGLRDLTRFFTYPHMIGSLLMISGLGFLSSILATRRVLNELNS